MLETQIANLEDNDATRILSAIAQSRIRSGAQSINWESDLRAALQSTTGLAPAAGPTSIGDLARQALLLLAEDPQMRNVIESMINRPPMKFGIIETAAVVTAVIVVLQTHIEFERDKSGKWQLKIKKKPTTDSLVKTVVEKLLSFVPKGPFG